MHQPAGVRRANSVPQTGGWVVQFGGGQKGGRFIARTSRDQDLAIAQQRCRVEFALVPHDAGH